MCDYTEHLLLCPAHPPRVPPQIDLTGPAFMKGLFLVLGPHLPGLYAQLNWVGR